MINSIKKRIFPSLITITALSISFIAAYVSVIGLGKLFAGAGDIIIIIASILEFSKVVIASILHTYRKTLALMMKIYLIIALVILMGITSIGIYGYLSGAYNELSVKTELVNKEAQIFEIKQNRFIETRNNFVIEKQQIDESINALREGLSNNKTQYKDKETGQIITTTSSSNRKSLELQLDNALEEKENISLKIEAITDSISKNELKIFEIQSKIDSSKELGPLKYISKITNREMDDVVNWLILLLMIVFDPLAICLVITSNFTFEQLRLENKDKIITLTSNNESEEIMEKPQIQENTEPKPEPELPSNFSLLSSFRKKKIKKEKGLE